MRFLLCFIFLVMTNSSSLATESITTRESIDELQDILNENAGTDREEHPAMRLAAQMLEQDKDVLNNQDGESNIWKGK